MEYKNKESKVKVLDIEKKIARRTFHFLAIAIMIYEAIFQFVVFGIDFIEMTRSEERRVGKECRL